MGDRGNVVVQYDNGSEVFLYTHWGRSELKETVADALDRGRDRWNDDSYLARIIFSEMTRDYIEDETGFGISPFITDGDRTVVINCEKQTANGKPFEEFVEKYQKASKPAIL